MSKKKIIIIVSICLLLIIIGIILFIAFIPKEVVKEFVKEYEVEVYKDIDLKELLKEDIDDNKKIDTEKLGTYEYKYIDSKNEEKTIKVKVVDKTAPIVMLRDTYYHIKGTNFTILEDTMCADNYDDEPTCTVEGNYDLDTVGTYDAVYTATDSSGNKFTKKFKVEVEERKKAEETKIPFEEVKERAKDNKLLIDVSKWEKDIDWKRVKESGIDYAFIRLGTEKYNTDEMILDPYFEKNYKEAKENGIKIGVYFFTYAKSIKEVEIRANFVVDNLKDKEIDLGVAYDFECWDIYNSMHLSLHKLNNIKDRFMEIIKENGYRPVLYSSKNYLEEVWDVNTDVWLAHYTEETNYKGDKLIWQFASNGVIPGIDTKTVDVNVYYE